MSSVIRAPRDFWSGVLFLVLGGGFVIMSLEFDLINARGRIGPGLFPLWVASLLTVIGAVIAARSLLPSAQEAEDGDTPVAARALLIISIGIIAFGLTIRPLGMLVALPLLVFICSWASRKTRLLPTLIASVGLCVFCWLVFAKGLGLPIPIAPWLF